MGDTIRRSLDFIFSFELCCPVFEFVPKSKTTLILFAQHFRLNVRSAFVEGGFVCGGCFFGGNETSDARESPICVRGFPGTFIPLIYRITVRGFVSRQRRSFACIARVF